MMNRAGRIQSKPVAGKSFLQLKPSILRVAIINKQIKRGKNANSAAVRDRKLAISMKRIDSETKIFMLILRSLPEVYLIGHSFSVLCLVQIHLAQVDTRENRHFYFVRRGILIFLI